MDTSKAKGYFWVLLNLVLAGMVVNLVFFVMPTIKKYGDSLYPVGSISISAEGKAIATPDVAQVSFSVVSRGKNPEELADNNNQKVSAAITFVKSEGIDAKDIKTSGYSLSPDYQYDPKTERNFITGYTLTQTVNLKIRDLFKVAKIIGGLTPLGVNQIGGINFTIDDPEKVMAQAREDAFARAKVKAAKMAEQGGVRLGRIISVGEYGFPGPIPYFSAAPGKFGLGGEAMSVAAPTIEPGTEEIRVQVTITYALK